MKAGLCLDSLAHLCRIDPLIQELLQGKHLTGGCCFLDLHLAQAASGTGKLQRPARQQGALVGGAGGCGLLDGAAAAAGPHFLVEAQAELPAALTVRPAEAAIQCTCGGGQ